MPDVNDRFNIGGRVYDFPTGVERLQSNSSPTSLPTLPRFAATWRP